MPLSKVDFERMVLSEGRPVNLLRRGTPDVVVSNILAKVRRARNSPETDDLTGGMVEDVYMIICTTVEMVAAGFSMPPENADRFQFDGEYHLVKAVYPLWLSQTLVGYRIQVQG